MNSPIAHDFNRSLLGSGEVKLSKVLESFGLKVDVAQKGAAWTVHLDSKTAAVGLKNNALDPCISTPSGEGNSRNAAVAQLCANISGKILIVDTGSKKEKILLPDKIAA
jgi:hypothetical protein